MDRAGGRHVAVTICSSVSPASALCGLGELGATAGEEIQDGHPYGDAVGDLVENDAERSVGDIGIDLDAAVHRARVENQNLVWRTLEPLARHAKDAVVLTEG